ncbi:MAG: glycoside hydrolase family 97 N-terminal domain-containing protein, partial [Bacteroidota bacterium]
MMQKHYWIPALIVLALTACERNPSSFQCFSPGGQLSVKVFERDTRIAYQVSFNEEVIIDTSFVGFEFLDAPALGRDLIVTNRVESSFSETWKMPWGEQLLVENEYQELLLELQEMSEPKRLVNLVFRVYDDGVGFRFEFPEQVGWSEATITGESTEFQLTADHQVWWIPGDWDIYEHLYRTTKVSEINAIQYRDHPNLAASHIPYNAVNTPVTMKTASGKYLSFHEADLTNYSGMTLRVDTATLKLTSELVGAKEGHKVKATLPFVTPWRTIQVAERAGDLIESNLIVNLNEPADSLLDISWFEPTKYIGIWWEMHLDKSTWQYEGGRHGATTENARRYIDFAAKNNIGALLIEGWNTGWERWIGFPDREGVFDFVTPYPDYDIEEVVNYGREQGVALIMHHETSAAPRTYDQQLDTAYR